MSEPKNNYKFVGIFGVVFALICLGSFFAGDNSKLIIPNSSIFIVKYFVVICIINSSLYFLIAGMLIYFGIYSPAYAETKAQLKKTKAKGFLLSVSFLSPSLLSLFTTIFIMSKVILWKVLGSLTVIYITWLIYTSIKIVKKND